MKVNGTQVDDLIGTGLFSKQRYVIPAWVTLFWIIFRFFARAVVKGVAWSVRNWMLTLPASLVASCGLRFGWLGFLGGLGWLTMIGIVWHRFSPDSFARLVAEPARGGWRWHLVYARFWAGAMNGTGLTRRTPVGDVFVPSVERVTSTAVVDTLHLRLLHGQTPEEFALQAEGLRHVFEAYRCKVVEDSPGRIRVVFYTVDPLTRVIRAIDPTVDTEGMPPLDGLLLGFAEDGEPYFLRLMGTHLLIAGATDAGKGSVLWSILRALAPGIHCGLIRVTGLDPKGGMELFPGRALFSHYADEDPEDLVIALEAAAVRMSERKTRLKATGVRKFVPSFADPFEVIVIDEIAFLTAYLADKKLKDRVTKALQLLLSQGRAPGFCVIAALQDPRKEALPFRNLFPTRIALRLAESADVDMVLGDGALDRGAACHRIPFTLPGVGFVNVDGAAEPVRVRFAYNTDEDIAEMADRWPAPALGEHRDLPGKPDVVIDLRDPEESRPQSAGRFPHLPRPRSAPSIEVDGPADWTGESA